MIHPAGAVGRRVITAAGGALDLLAFTRHMIAVLFRRHREGRALVRRVVAEQIYFTAVQALPVLLPMALIVGSLLIIQFNRLSGEIDTGRTVILLVVREIGPLTTALLVILRSATAVTIEIGYMNALNEFEALEGAGIDPMRVIVIPRLIGITSAIVSLFILFDAVSLMGGYAVVWTITWLPMGDFQVQLAKAISGADILVGLIKAVFFGVTITAICIKRGVDIGKRITAVPLAVSRAAVECLFYCLLINIGISALFYL